MVDHMAVAIRFAAFADLLIAFGLVAFTPYGVGLGDGGSFGFVLRRWLAVAACIGLVVTAASVLIIAANMAGIPLTSVDLPSVGFVLGGTFFGFCQTRRAHPLLRQESDGLHPIC